MTSYALVNSLGAIVRRENFSLGQQPILAPAKGLRWVLDIPPAFNPETQIVTATVPVAPDAAEITYTVSTSPAHIEAVSRANAEALIRKQAADMEATGDKVGALKFLLQQGLKP